MAVMTGSKATPAPELPPPLIRRMKNAGKKSGYGNETKMMVTQMGMPCRPGDFPVRQNQPD
jgi:hypothetical protein